MIFKKISFHKSTTDYRATQCDNNNNNNNKQKHISFEHNFNWNFNRCKPTQHYPVPRRKQTRRTCSSLSAHPFRQQIRDALEIQYSSRGANLEARSRSIGGFRKCTATGVPNLCLVYFHLFVAWLRSHSLSEWRPTCPKQDSSENLSRNRLSRETAAIIREADVDTAPERLKGREGALLLFLREGRNDDGRFETETIFDDSSFENFIRLERERERERRNSSSRLSLPFSSRSSLEGFWW